MKRSGGFTLIELLMGIVILAILLGVGIPSFRQFIQNNRATTITNDLVAAVHLARSEALRRRANVTVCAGTGGACVAQTSWAIGWQVIAGGTAMQVWPAPQGNPAITAPAAGITFTDSGLTTLGANAVITVALAGCTGDERRTITVLPTGRLNTARTAC